MRAVNLLPTDLRSADRRGRAAAAGAPEGSPAGAYAVLGGLAAVVVATAVTVLATNGIHERERELASVKAEQVVAQREVAKLAPYGSFRQVSEQRSQTVRQLADSRFDWEQTLRDLSRAIPSDVTLAKISGTVTPGTSTAGGASSNPLRAAIAAPAIELSGCTSSQPAVARLMSRMRAIQGVTRVSLASSEKEDSQDASAAGVDLKPAGCGKGAPPRFEIVLFFEGTKAVAGSAPAPAAPAAGASASASAPAGAAPSASATPAPGAAPASPSPSSTPTAPATGEASTAPAGATSEVSAK